MVELAGITLDGDVALAGLRALGEARKFPQAGDPRREGGLLIPRLRPRFRVRPGQRAFTIGSCFAREIEAQLDGFDLPTLAVSLPPDEVGGRGNSILNEFNPGSIAQRIGWAVDGFDTTTLTESHAGGPEAAEDLLLRKGHRVPLARLFEIRRMVDGIYRRLPGSDLLIVTLGMTEVWRDEEQGLFLNRLPALRDIQRQPRRFRFLRLSVAETVELLGGAFDKLLASGLGRMLLTVSPVPLQATFAAQDCIVANGHSKAVLRSAAEALAGSFGDRVDYFPSFEIVQSGGLPAFEADMIHVRRDVVARITRLMIESYVEQAPQG